MSTNAQRKIKNKWRVALQKHSDIHEAGSVLPAGNWQEFDPFLVMAEDKFRKNAFDHHPHRGMETVTYIIDGELQHSDNKGGAGILHKGDAQWMTAGSGVIHLEEPPANTVVHSLQLWVNLPKDKKMVTPRYQDIPASNVPIRKEKGAIYRVFSGNSAAVISPTKNYVPVTMVDISVEEGQTATQDLPSSYNGFIYILEGAGVFGANSIQAVKGEALQLDAVTENTKISEIVIQALKPLRLIFIAGEPLHEQVVARGPFVMTSEEEIQQAYADFRAGKF